MCFVLGSPSACLVSGNLNTNTPSPPAAAPARSWTRCTGLADTFSSFDAWDWSKFPSFVRLPKPAANPMSRGGFSILPPRSRHRRGRFQHQTSKLKVVACSVFSMYCVHNVDEFEVYTQLCPSGSEVFIVFFLRKLSHCRARPKPPF